MNRTTLFAHVLSRLGFRVTCLAARVFWMRAETDIPARTHMTLLVDLPERRLITDVGFGVVNPTAPLRLEPHLVQETPLETFRFEPLDEELRLQAHLDGEWRTLYRFDLTAQRAIDYEVANHFVATHPASRFRTGLAAARVAPAGRHTLRNRSLAFHGKNGKSVRQSVASPSQLMEALRDIFLIDPPPELASAWRRIPDDEL